MNTAQTVILLIFMVGTFLVAILLIPQFFLKRAMRELVRLFRNSGALDPNSAKPLEDVGYKQRGLMGSMMQGRDYRPYALNLMMKQQIIRTTEDDRYYLSEETLAASRLLKEAPKAG